MGRRESSSAVRNGAIQTHETALVQVLPGHRVRLAPDAVPDVACLLTAIGERWYRVANQTFRGLKGDDRERAKRNAEYGKRMLEALNAIIRALMETQDVDAYQRAKIAWWEALTGEGSAEGVTCSPPVTRP